MLPWRTFALPLLPLLQWLSSFFFFFSVGSIIFLDLSPSSSWYGCLSAFAPDSSHLMRSSQLLPRVQARWFRGTRKLHQFSRRRDRFLSISTGLVQIPVFGSFISVYQVLHPISKLKGGSLRPLGCKFLVDLISNLVPHFSRFFTFNAVEILAQQTNQ